MILAGTLMLPGSRAVRLAPGWLRIEGERIAEVHEGACPHTADIGGDGVVITPGFIDAHLHLPQWDSVGADGLTLLDWLARVVFPAEARWADPAFAADMTARVGRDLFAVGTTGVAAYATVHSQSAIDAMNVLADMGFCGWLGQVLMDQQAPDELCRPASQLAHECALMQPVGRMVPAITPRFAVSCSAELMALSAKVAHEKTWPIQTHLSEMPGECELVKRLHGVDRYLDAYGRAGLLTERTLFAHGVHLDPIERSALGKVGAAVAHCPTSNTFLRSGIMDHAGLTAGRIRIALGSDIAGGPCASMPRVASAMIDAAKHRAMLDEARGGAAAADMLAAAHAWWQITAGNAEVLGLRESGVLAAGAWADVLVIRPASRWQDAPDPLGALLYGWDDRWLAMTLAAGRTRYEAEK